MLWFHRTQRGGEDHHHQNLGDLAEAEFRGGSSLWFHGGVAKHTHSTFDRIRPRFLGGLRRHVGAGVPAVLCQLLWHHWISTDPSGG